METKTIVVEVESNLGSLKSQLREAQAEVAAMSEKFGATSVEAMNAAKAAGRLKDTIGDAKQLTDAFNPDAKFKALTASMSGALNGFQAVQGAMGLFGAEGKAVQETLLKVQSAMALAQGVDGLLEARDAFKTFGAQAISAFKSIAAAVAANPLGLLLTVIALAATAFVYLESTAQTAAERMSKGFNGVANAIHESTLNLERQNKIQNTTTETTLKNLDKEARRRIAMGEDSVKVQREINNLKIKTLEIAIEEDKALVRQKKAELEIILTIEAQTKARLMAQITRVKIDMANSTTSIGQAYEAKKLIDLGEQYAKIESDANKTKQESLKLIYSTTAEIIASKDAVENLKISQLELNKAEKDGRDAAKKDEPFKLDKIGTLKTKAVEELEVKREILEVDFSLEEEYRQKGIAAEKAAAEKKAEDDKIAQDAEVQRKLKNFNIVMDLTKDSLQGISDLVAAFAGKSKAAQKKAFATQKKLNIAIATIDTIKGAVGAFNGMVTSIPGPVGIALGVVAAAGVAASGVAQVKKISSTTFDGGGGGGDEGGGGGGGGGGMNAPAVPTPANFNVVGNSGTNQLMQGLQNQPIKAYVVGGDVTTAQNLDRNKITTASI
jgi:hypothetical protein